MTAKPMKTLELHYPMVQVLIIRNGATYRFLRLVLVLKIPSGKAFNWLFSKYLPNKKSQPALLRNYA